MAETKTPAEIAERLQKRRARLMLLFPALFVSQQSMFWSHHLIGGPLRTVDKVQVSAYVFWALALLVMLATGGSLGRSKAVRELLSDESTRAHRGFAYAVGFWAMILACMLLYVLSLLQTLTPSVMLHVLLTAGVLAPCITFAVLELRASRG